MNSAARKPQLLSAVLGLLALLSACGGGDDAADARGTTARVLISAEAPGARCKTGGFRIDAGLDADANGTLDPNEITTTGHVCNGRNGAKGTDGTDSTDGSEPGTELTWSVVTSTAQQAEVNNGYIAANDSAQVVITLPASAAVGEIVRIAGAGAGGWKVEQNAGQTINGGPLGVEAGASWTPHGPVLEWPVVSSSADGIRLAAADWHGSIWTSTDRGQTWTERLADVDQQWTGVASSADGQRLVAAAYAGYLYTSSNGGATWTARMTDATRWWYDVASSSDGLRLVAAEAGGTLHVSTDGGQTWTPRATDMARSWLAVTSSSDGMRLAAVESTGYVHTSTDGGVTWTQRGASRDWADIASSADGQRLVAVGYGDAIFTSVDGGVTWTPRDSPRTWISVASSADGQRLVAVEQDGRIYASTDAGVSWTPRESDRTWRSTAMSAAGDSLVALAANEPIYTSTSWTTIGTTGAISGGAYDSIELQSLGDGRFNVIGHEGSPAVE